MSRITGTSKRGPTPRLTSAPTAVRELRLAARLTQAELAQAAGVSLSTVERAEGIGQGGFPWSVRVWSALASALDVSIEDIIPRA